MKVNNGRLVWQNSVYRALSYLQWRSTGCWEGPSACLSLPDLVLILPRRKTESMLWLLRPHVRQNCMQKWARLITFHIESCPSSPAWKLCIVWSLNYAWTRWTCDSGSMPCQYFTQYSQDMPFTPLEWKVETPMQITLNVSWILWGIKRIIYRNN